MYNLSLEICAIQILFSLTNHSVMISAGWDHFEASEVGFKELYDMYTLVTRDLGQEAIILDADDLLKNPGELIKDFTYLKVNLKTWGYLRPWHYFWIIQPVRSYLRPGMNPDPGLNQGNAITE